MKYKNIEIARRKLAKKLELSEQGNVRRKRDMSPERRWNRSHARALSLR